MENNLIIKENQSSEGNVVVGDGMVVIYSLWTLQISMNYFVGV